MKMEYIKQEKVLNTAVNASILLNSVLFHDFGR